uniref:Uncharacterized protein n=1 Tax=Panagrolaimus sp. PS1159 TaxID=55785 RepID=A0AC35FJR2_9BILA
DDSVNPLFASTHALNGDIKNYTRHAWFLEFYGNVTQFEDYIYDYEFSGPEVKDCYEYPKAQAIIDKIEKMGISDLDKWSRLCMKELKATFKTPSSTVFKRRGAKLSYLFEGEESREGMQNEDIKPKMCQSKTKTDIVLLIWVEM